MEFLQRGTENSPEFFGAVRPVNARQLAAEVRKRRSEVLNACLHQGDAINGHFGSIYRNMVEALDTLIETGAVDSRDVAAKERALKEFEDWFDPDDPAFLSYQMRVATEALSVRPTRIVGLRAWVMGALGALIFHS